MFQGGTFIVVLFLNCFAVFHFLMFYSFNNYEGLRYIQFSLSNKVATVLRNRCQLCLPYVHFVAAKLYVSVFPIGF